VAGTDEIKEEESKEEKKRAPERAPAAPAPVMDHDDDRKKIDKMRRLIAARYPGHDHLLPADISPADALLVAHRLGFGGGAASASSSSSSSSSSESKEKEKESKKIKKNKKSGDEKKKKKKKKKKKDEDDTTTKKTTKKRKTAPADDEDDEDEKRSTKKTKKTTIATKKKKTTTTKPAKKKKKQRISKKKLQNLHASKSQYDRAAAVAIEQQEEDEKEVEEVEAEGKVIVIPPAAGDDDDDATTTAVVGVPAPKRTVLLRRPRQTGWLKVHSRQTYECLECDNTYSHRDFLKTISPDTLTWEVLLMCKYCHSRQVARDYTKGPFAGMETSDPQRRSTTGWCAGILASHDIQVLSGTDGTHDRIGGMFRTPSEEMEDKTQCQGLCEKWCEKKEFPTEKEIRLSMCRVCKKGGRTAGARIHYCYRAGISPKIMAQFPDFQAEVEAIEADEESESRDTGSIEMNKQWRANKAATGDTKPFLHWAWELSSVVLRLMQARKEGNEEYFEVFKAALDEHCNDSTTWPRGMTSLFDIVNDRQHEILLKCLALEPKQPGEEEEEEEEEGSSEAEAEAEGDEEED
jgi:hypothetical protein